MMRSFTSPEPCPGLSPNDITAPLHPRGRAGVKSPFPEEEPPRPEFDETPESRENGKHEEGESPEPMIFACEQAGETVSAPRHITIFDWDDTLLCTSWMDTNGIRPELAHHAGDFAALETVVERVLGKALAVGKVFIITNSVEGWVNLTAAMCMPAILPYLEQAATPAVDDCSLS